MTDDLEKLRIRFGEIWTPRRAATTKRPRSFVGKVTSTGAALAVGKFAMVQPQAVTGAETEGMAGTFTAKPTPNIPVYQVGPHPFSTGDLIPCHFVDYRWVGERMSPAGSGGYSCTGCTYSGTTLHAIYYSNDILGTLGNCGSPGNQYNYGVSGPFTATLSYVGNGSNIHFQSPWILVNPSELGTGYPFTGFYVQFDVNCLGLTVFVSNFPDGTSPTTQFDSYLTSSSSSCSPFSIYKCWQSAGNTPVNAVLVTA